MVQRVRLCAPNAGGAGSMPGQGTKIPHAVWCGKKNFFFKVKHIEKRKTLDAMPESHSMLIKVHNIISILQITVFKHIQQTLRNKQNKQK